MWYNKNKAGTADRTSRAQPPSPLNSAHSTWEVIQITGRHGKEQPIWTHRSSCCRDFRDPLKFTRRAALCRPEVPFGTHGVYGVGGNESIWTPFLWQGEHESSGSSKAAWQRSDGHGRTCPAFLWVIITQKSTVKELPQVAVAPIRDGRGLLCGLHLQTSLLSLSIIFLPRCCPFTLPTYGWVDLWRGNSGQTEPRVKVQRLLC